MKYYSEKLEKIFDTIDELQLAEATEKTKEERVKEIEEEIKENFITFKNAQERIAELQKEKASLMGTRILDKFFILDL